MCMMNQVSTLMFAMFILWVPHTIHSHVGPPPLVAVVVLQIGACAMCRRSMHITGGLTWHCQPYWVSTCTANPCSSTVHCSHRRLKGWSALAQRVGTSWQSHLSTLPHRQVLSFWECYFCGTWALGLGNFGLGIRGLLTWT
jgi:hypothetical protein